MAVFKYKNDLDICMHAAASKILRTWDVQIYPADLFFTILLVTIDVQAWNDCL
jgi:hypothetical protein